MVEGPGATRNGRKLQPVNGCIVADVVVTTVENQELFRRTLVNKRVDQVFSIGKEVFLIFRKDCDDNDNSQEEIALRLHFGMNGSLYLHKDGETSQHPPPWRRNTSSTLVLHLERDQAEESSSSLSRYHHLTIETKDSTTSLVSANVARSKLDRLQKRDVCGSNFDANAVAEAIVDKRSEALIADALLDQERFPGVGNIIKIEGLHRSRIHPKRLVSSLSHDELKRTIVHCREYAIKWLSSGRAPSKSVYNQTECGTCQGSFTVKMMKLGNDLSRVTFWCSNCQPFLPHMADQEHINMNNQAQTHLQNVTQTFQNSFGGNIDVVQQNMASVSCNKCPQHGGESLLLRQVRKADSCNKHRLIRLCKVPTCQFFSWADMHLPMCSCQHRAILRISKTERSGGRWFLSCGTKQKCNFFSWAEATHLKHFGRSLTPLL